MKKLLTPKVSWLSVTSKRGKSSGEWDDFEIHADIADLPAGIHEGLIEVSSGNATNSPVYILITMNIQ
jgi:hypothetical protein